MGNTVRTDIDEQWATLSEGEKELIRSMIVLIRTARHSHRSDVALAGRKWEAPVKFFFRMRLTHAAGQQQRRRRPRPATPTSPLILQAPPAPQKP